MTITVFTPTYNRASYLQRLYESLTKQTFSNFEWLIVDDGSTDKTKECIAEMAKTNPSFPIKYYYKENGGKHTAINYGVKIAEGELLFIVDSDDSLPENSLEIISKYYERIKCDKSYAGVCGLISHHNGERIGSGFPEECVTANTIEIRNKFGVTGDLREVFRASILREFPFPEIEGERFCPEILVWNRIAESYKLYCFNETIYYADYLEGGLTDNIVKARMKSPVASMTCYAEMTKQNISLIQKTKAAINYWRFRMCAKQIIDAPLISKLWMWVLPLAWVMHQKDLSL